MPVLPANRQWGLNPKLKIDRILVFGNSFLTARTNDFAVLQKLAKFRRGLELPMSLSGNPVENHLLGAL